MTPCWLLVLLCSPLWQTEGVKGWGGLSTVPSESECRPYIEKALKELTPETPQEAVDTTGSEHTTPSQSTDQEGSIEETEEATTKESKEGEAQGESAENGDTIKSETTNEVPGEGEPKESEEIPEGDTESIDSTETPENTPFESVEDETTSTETEESQQPLEDDKTSIEKDDTIEESSTESSDRPLVTEEQLVEASDENIADEKSKEEEETKSEEDVNETPESQEQVNETSQENDEIQEASPEESGQEDTTAEVSAEEGQRLKEEDITEESAEHVAVSEEQTVEESNEVPEGEAEDSVEKTEESQATESAEATESTESESVGKELNDSTEDATETTEVSAEETSETTEVSAEETAETTEASAETTEASVEETSAISTEETAEIREDSAEEVQEITKETEETTESPVEDTVEEASEETKVASDNIETSGETATESSEITEGSEQKELVQAEATNDTSEAASTQDGAESTEAESPEEAEEQAQAVEDAVAEPESTVEDQLTLEFEAPTIRRPRDHIAEILHLTSESSETELLLAKTIESTLKELKRLYDNAIKPLEILFKYRDLSNRHFGDPEIFSKPLILFMGPWSGGKSTILNYLLDNEFKSSSLRTGAEPSPAYFNILMWGEREEVLDGTQLAADWTFSGLQKFGQGLLDRLRGLRLNSPLLEKVNIVEIPGILEIRKQVERLFPFNDACQWFIDRADIIFLVYDPSKLDVGPETEAILDQLKGREYQTRIILNKADQVKPEELMRVQGTLIWNISPLMSSQEPPVMYSTSLWSIPYELGAPSRLLHAQERSFLRDLRQAIDKRVENKIASARRFAVRVRNHAKMVDCYLTTYYNHKTFFGNRKKVADDIIEHPQNYHIYEGLSTLTNISRYDLPDPEVYRDFFRLNPVYEFQRLSDTCTYFRGCPINRLDVAIAYDLPELVGKYKKQAEKVLEAAEKQATKS